MIRKKAVAQESVHSFFFYADDEARLMPARALSPEFFLRNPEFTGNGTNVLIQPPII